MEQCLKFELKICIKTDVKRNLFFLNKILWWRWDLLFLHLLPLLNLWLIVEVWPLNLFYWYYFGRCSSERAQLVPLSVTIPRCRKDAFVISFFPPTAGLWNFMPIECFPLTYDLSGFKSRITRYLLSVGSF